MKNRLTFNWLGALFVITFTSGGIETPLSHAAERASDFRPEPQTSPCKGTLSGAISLSFDCKISAGYDKIKQVSGVGIIGVNLPENIQSLGAAHEIKGALTATQYNTTNKAFENYGATVVVNRMQYFVNSKKFQRAQSLQLTSVSERAATEKGSVYDVHGSFDATLNQVYPPSAETLTVHVEF